MIDCGKWPPTEYAPILTALGSFLYQWNELERVVQHVVIDLAGGTVPVKILAAQIGTLALHDALASIATQCLSSPASDHFLHACRMFNALRVSRNYFVHGFDTIGAITNFYHDERGNITRTEFIEAMGWVKNQRRKETYSVYVADIERAACECQTTKNYLSSAHTVYKALGEQPHPSWPEMPILPDSARDVARRNKERR